MKNTTHLRRNLPALRRFFAAVCAAVLCAAPISGCRHAEEAQNPSENDGVLTKDQLEALLPDGPVMPEGDITEIWFDEPFAAFYPKQLDDIYFSKMYLYGEAETSQPVVCLCSETLTDLAVIDLASGDTLYEAASLEPMEALVLQVLLTETPAFAVRFTDTSGSVTTCTLAANADGSEVVYSYSADA